MHFPGKQGHYYSQSKSNVILETIRALKKTMKPKSHRKQENPAPTINSITMKEDKQKNKRNHCC